MAEDVGGLAGWILDVVQALGYPGIALLVALETVVPPIPSEIVLPASGFLVAQGELSFLGVLFASTLGSVVGALALYALARHVGARRVERWVERHGRWLTVEPEELRRAQAWFDKRGHWAVLVGRVVPALRSLVSLPAGLARMPVGRFVLWTALGSLVWNGVLLAAGWRLGESWSAVGPYYEKVEWALWGTFLGLFAWRFARQQRRHERRQGGARGA